VDILLGISLKRPTKSRSRVSCKVNRISHLWSWRRDLNHRPSDYKSAYHPVSCCILVVIRRVSSLLVVQFGGFWVSNSPARIPQNFRKQPRPKIEHTPTIHLYCGAPCVRSWSKYQSTGKQWALCVYDTRSGREGAQYATEDRKKVDCPRCAELMHPETCAVAKTICTFCEADAQRVRNGERHRAA
jgi:hypothetical protein